MPTTRSKQLRNRRKTKTAQAPAAAGQGIAQGLGRGLKSVGRLMGLGAAAPHKPMSRAEAEELGRVFDYPLGEGYQTPLFPLEGRPKHFTTGAGGAMFDVPQERSRKPAAQPAGQFVPGVAPGAQRFISDLSPQGGSMGFDLSGLGGGAQQQLDLTPAAAMAGRVAQGVGSFLQSPGGKLATGRYQPPAGAAPAPAAAPATMMGPNGMTAVPGSNGGYNVRGPNGETYGLRDLRHLESAGFNAAPAAAPATTPDYINAPLFGSAELGEGFRRMAHSGQAGAAPAQPSVAQQMTAQQRLNLEQQGLDREAAGTASRIDAITANMQRQQYDAGAAAFQQRLASDTEQLQLRDPGLNRSSMVGGGQQARPESLQLAQDQAFASAMGQQPGAPRTVDLQGTGQPAESNYSYTEHGPLSSRPPQYAQGSAAAIAQAGRRASRQESLDPANRQAATLARMDLRRQASEAKAQARADEAIAMQQQQVFNAAAGGNPAAIRMMGMMMGQQGQMMEHQLGQERNKIAAEEAAGRREHNQALLGLRGDELAMRGEEVAAGREFKEKVFGAEEKRAAERLAFDKQIAADAAADRQRGFGLQEQEIATRANDPLRLAQAKQAEAETKGMELQLEQLENPGSQPMTMEEQGQSLASQAEMAEATPEERLSRAKTIVSQMQGAGATEEQIRRRLELLGITKEVMLEDSAPEKGWGTLGGLSQLESFYEFATRNQKVPYDRHRKQRKTAKEYQPIFNILNSGS